jgi:hypothetical protein
MMNTECQSARQEWFSIAFKWRLILMGRPLSLRNNKFFPIAEGMKAIHEHELGQLTGYAVVIDVIEQVSENRDYRIQREYTRI